ncbi:GntR family transcriptional regulator [Streptomyces cinnamoneus]|uniref:GntR family transcriptional regulator n=1 Tax=Streptomyces cinnamoneus TaxID=53446 RepID=A0A2G1XHV7_STRCJ|nr:GntR family transcriptional regulator [Streptomyces cinnamoneus]PHQ50813.1 GntR family transcriptional regulator [Streptomyces cinnamoneus]PPT13929.1 GntR family transcriptional regulator [Streptomyces cinnamoneus]
MPGSDPVKRTTLRSQIADALREEVIAGRLPAGRQFTVKEIAEQYGVSATPVREALLDLCSQGLLDVELHKAYRVREFSYADFRDMVEARTLIVEGMFRRSAERALLSATPESLGSVRRRAEEAGRAALAGDLDILIGYDLRFWREMAGLVGNPYISDFLDRVRVQSWVFTVPLLRRLDDLRGRLWHRHTELVEAVAGRDVARAQRIIVEYNAHTLALVDGLSGAAAGGAGRSPGSPAEGPASA